ncbi:MAG: hypothetical protein EOP42_15635 [Sphingobacteriaceae bacterium]|nr:MAG: hypothetical protein EOP42_15635 [Sphingobacteriaceae bacterium]
MKLVLDITTEEQKENFITLANQLNVSVEILDADDATEDAEMIKAIKFNAKNDLLTAEETKTFLDELAK